MRVHIISITIFYNQFMWTSVNFNIKNNVSRQFTFVFRFNDRLCYFFGKNNKTIMQLTDRLYNILYWFTYDNIKNYNNIHVWLRANTNIVTFDSSYIAFEIFLNLFMNSEYLQWCAYLKRRVIVHYYYWTNLFTLQ